MLVLLTDFTLPQITPSLMSYMITSVKEQHVFALNAVLPHINFSRVQCLNDCFLMGCPLVLCFTLENTFDLKSVAHHCMKDVQFCYFVICTVCVH